MNKCPNRADVAAAVALLAIAAHLPAVSKDEPPPVMLPSAPNVLSSKASDNSSSIRLTLVQQRESGLRTARLEALVLRREMLAYGKVIEIQPLLEMRARYRAAQSDELIAIAALRVAQKNHQRLASLHRESIVAARELIQAESQLAADNARTAAASRHMREIRAEALQLWGSELSRLAVEDDSVFFDKFLSREQSLLLIALPANRSLPQDVRLVKIAPTGNRHDAHDARLVSPAPRTDDTIQGETWFFTVETGNLRTGMRLDAWIPQGGAATPGVALPLSAVVWHNGKPWVYLKADSQSFTRHPVADHLDYGDAWFVSRGFQPGDEVVITGGQMLLSEEFRRQIPEERDD